MLAANVEDLLEAVKQLPPDQLAQFTVHFAQWHESAGPFEPLLIQQSQQSLPAQDQKRLAKLTVKSERRQLTEVELSEYRELAQRAERINATRIRALAELAQLRHQPIQTVMDEMGWREPTDGR